MGKETNGKVNPPEKAERPPLVTQPTDGYSEAQDEEREVLKAIYMDDFKEVEAKGAWSVCYPHIFSELHSFLFSDSLSHLQSIATDSRIDHD